MYNFPSLRCIYTYYLCRVFGRIYGFYNHAQLYAALLPDIDYVMSLDSTKDAKSRHTFIVVVSSIFRLQYNLLSISYNVLMDVRIVHHN